MAERNDAYVLLASYQRRNPWKLDDGRTLWLMRPQEIAEFPNGTEAFCIFADRRDCCPHVKGRDEIDGDTRGGYLAFGLVEPAHTTVKEDDRG